LLIAPIIKPRRLANRTPHRKIEFDPTKRVHDRSNGIGNITGNSGRSLEARSEKQARLLFHGSTMASRLQTQALF
jgi:hypothetical protein